MAYHPRNVESGRERVNRAKRLQRPCRCFSVCHSCELSAVYTLATGRETPILRPASSPLLWLFPFLVIPAGNLLFSSNRCRLAGAPSLIHMLYPPTARGAAWGGTSRCSCGTPAEVSRLRSPLKGKMRETPDERSHAGADVAAQICWMENWCCAIGASCRQPMPWCEAIAWSGRAAAGRHGGLWRSLWWWTWASSKGRSRFPAGMTTRKSKGKGKSNCKGRSRFPAGMTTRKSKGKGKGTAKAEADSQRE